LLTLQELLQQQRQSAPARCERCGRAGSREDNRDDDDAIIEALRHRIRVLEANLAARDAGTRMNERSLPQS
jgi:hypothetical protein